MPVWRHLGGVDPKTLREARVQAHYAAQRIGAPAVVLLNAKPDWSHTALTWNDKHQALVSAPLPSGTSLGLRLPDLDMIELKDDIVVHDLDLAGRSNEDINYYLANHLEAYGVTAEKLANATYSGMPDHSVAQGGPYDPNGLASEFAEIARWYSNAARAIEMVREELLNVSPGPSAVYCWPHHFDIACLVTFEEGDPETARAIGIGMSPGDTAYEQPYFYVNPWPRLSRDELLPLQPPGHWHIEGFVGAIATGADIVEQDDQESAVMTYIREAVRIGRNKLGV